MKVAVVHSFYRSDNPSGENVAVNRMVDILKSKGHEVLVLGKSSDNNSSFFKLLSIALRFIFNLGWNPDREIRNFDPDVIHIHNLFPNISSKFLDNWGNISVMTIHNFRLLCANGLLLRNSKFCNSCLEQSSVSALRYRCYKESFLQTLPWFIRQRFDPRGIKTLSRVNRIICLNDHVKEIFLHYVSPNLDIRVLPNLVSISKNVLRDNANGTFIFAGNLTPEKGILELVNAWNAESPLLEIFGDGPVRSKLPTKKNVAFRGLVSSEIVRSNIANACGVIIPSICLENLPTVYLEALSVGTPVIVNRPCSISDEVISHNVGFVFDDFSEIETFVEKLNSTRMELSENAKQLFLKYYHPERVIDNLEALYTDLQSEI